MSKKDLSEQDICTKFITPALEAAGWDNHRQIRQEVTFTNGRTIVRGKLVTRGKAKRADNVLYYQPNLPIALIEAKGNTHAVGAGMQQALDYTEALDIPFFFTSNGDSFVFHDRTECSASTESEIPLNCFPSPAQLWSRYCQWKGLKPEQESLILQDYYQDPSSAKEPRYYQRKAINKAIEAIAKGQDCILLVMATGIGKTYTAFQIIWRLWKARRKKRILFLADRNVLVDQTMANDFRPFGPAMAKLSTRRKTIEREDGAHTALLTALDTKTRRIDTSYEDYLALYQAITGPEDSQKIYRELKLYFTLVDFRGASNNFADPDFDGPPTQIYQPEEGQPMAPPDDAHPTDDPEAPIPPQPGDDEIIVFNPDAQPPDIGIPIDATADSPRKYYLDGVEVQVVAERVQHLDQDGKLVTESLRDYSRRTLKLQFTSLDQFPRLWSDTGRKQVIIQELESEGLFLDPLADEVGKDLDPFDPILHVAFDRPPLTRRERAENVRKRDVFTVFKRYGPQVRAAVLEALLQKYQDEPAEALSDPGILRVAPLSTLGTPLQLLNEFGGLEGFLRAVHELQSAIYAEVA